ncbi:MAG: hypothetical protein JRG67_08500 [Deltaproteobacteria bacterium]|nr:hypothetical protein [Deltaproteobacteria bacterium]MBW2381302.1 hypothetical protein [Deltaproteobacteria bacterium]
MRILIQTGTTSRRGSLGAWAPPLVVATALFCAAGTAQAQTGQIRCSVTENGSPARGTIVVEQNGKEVGGGSCGAALSVPVGKCKVTVRLDGTLDNPSKSVNVEVTAKKATPVSVDFQTGVLEVRIETKGQRGTGIVTVNRGSTRIGTLGSGVAARLSAGSYEVVVRLGGEERRYSVELRPGQRRLVRAQF